jgi:hypothetical protein
MDADDVFEQALRALESRVTKKSGGTKTAAPKKSTGKKTAGKKSVEPKTS